MQDWTLLNNERRGLLEEVAGEWKTLLNNTKLKELVYHKFLEGHAGLFFSDLRTYIVVSNLEMGADLKPDLVVVSDNQSFGFKYELIELESPHDQVFTSKKRQTAKLTHALQQVEDWQRWLEKHPDSAKELFPSKAHWVWGDPQVSYTVIIGRRAEMIQNNEIRIQKSTKYLCSIRSFDHLTDKLRENLFLSFGIFDHAGRLSEAQVNRIVSPFFQAMSSAAWKSYCTSPDFSQYHSLGCSGPGLLEYRPEDIALLDRFLQFDKSK
jgi:hypothetical protein